MTTELIDIPCPDSRCPVTSTVTAIGPMGCNCAKDCGTKTLTSYAIYNCPFITAPAPVMTGSFQIE